MYGILFKVFKNDPTKICGRQPYLVQYVQLGLCVCLELRNNLLNLVRITTIFCQLNYERKEQRDKCHI